MHTSRFVVLLGLAAAGCGYSVPTSDAEYHPACYSQDSCPNGWTCGSVWISGELCNDPNRGSMRDGKVVVSDGSVIWGYDCPEACIPFTCLDSTPAIAAGLYCYENAATCGSTHCAPGQKCGLAPDTGSFVLRCLDPGTFAPGINNCPCPADHPYCRVVLEASPTGNSYQVCSNQP